MEVKIRGVDPVVIKKIDEMAKAHGISRNEYLKKCLTRYAVLQDIADLDSKYTALVNLLAERLEQANDVIENNSMILEKIQGATNGT